MKSGEGGWASEQPVAWRCQVLGEKPARKVLDSHPILEKVEVKRRER